MLQSTKILCWDVCCGINLTPCSCKLNPCLLTAILKMAKEDINVYSAMASTQSLREPNPLSTNCVENGERYLAIYICSRHHNLQYFGPSLCSNISYQVYFYLAPCAVRPLPLYPHTTYLFASLSPFSRTFTLFPSLSSTLLALAANRIEVRLWWKCDTRRGCSTRSPASSNPPPERVAQHLRELAVASWRLPPPFRPGRRPFVPDTRSAPRDDRDAREREEGADARSASARRRAPRRGCSRRTFRYATHDVCAESNAPEFAESDASNFASITGDPSFRRLPSPDRRASQKRSRGDGKGRLLQPMARRNLIGFQYMIAMPEGPATCPTNLFGLERSKF